MPVYLVAAFTCADRAAARAVWGNLDPDACADGKASISVHDTPPVILTGLVKGGEIRTMAEWKDTPGGSLYVDAANRPYLSGARAVAYGALPITWYHYEAP